jgi:hypothetical protein
MNWRMPGGGRPAFSVARENDDMGGIRRQLILRKDIPARKRDGCC